MSDLQCAATLLLCSLPGAWSAADRVAMVYDARGPGGSCVEGTRSIPRLAAGDVLERDPDTMTALRDLADVHRGETVAVLVEEGPDLTVRIDGDGVEITRSESGAARPRETPGD